MVLFTGPLGGKGERGDKGDRGITTTLKGDQFPTGIIEGPPGPPGKLLDTPTHFLFHQKDVEYLDPIYYFTRFSNPRRTG